MRILSSTFIHISSMQAYKLCLFTCVLALTIGQSAQINADALLDIDGSKDKHIRPDIKQQDFKPAQIDSENFEVLAYVGSYDFEGFDTRAIYGVKGTFHFSPTFFLDVDYGNSELKGHLDPTDATTDINESIVRYDAGLGMNIMQGQVFRKNGKAFTNQLYLKYSLGKIDINSQKNSFNSLGLGIRLLHPNDKVSLQVGLNKDSVDTNGGSNASNLKFFTGLGFYF